MTDVGEEWKYFDICSISKIYPSKRRSNKVFLKYEKVEWKYYIFSIFFIWIILFTVVK